MVSPQTHSPHSLSQNALLSYHRDVNSAVDYILTNGVKLNQGGPAAGGGSGFNEAQAKALFDGFKSTNEMGEVVMDQDAIESFMSQIGVDASSDIVAIWISHYMEAQYMGEFQWEEFKKGCQKLSVHSIAGWTSAVARLRQEMTVESHF